MLSIHTNTAALSAQRAMGWAQQMLSTSMTRLSTGFRINSAMDDAAGLQIATRLSAQTSGMAVAMRNTQNSTSLLQTAEGAFGEVTSMLVRMKDLATQAADASSNQKDREAMQGEYDALGAELYNVMTNTRYGGTLLLGNGSAGMGTLSQAMTFQIGATGSETMQFSVAGDMGALNTALQAISVNFAPGATAGSEFASNSSANGMIDMLAAAVDKVGSVRSALGATANRLGHVYNNLSNMVTNTKAAIGRIMDVDYAAESANMTSAQMLMQASTAMLKQSQSMSKLILSLLQ
ncbi:Lateral flagellin [Janthinobacterium sp. KBS0711]|uniref:flagellin N-terminal helical domain-containing protein n=1 Tax=Janthinobacterium sp. KBS0711 TaxID=1649647 RepID=UPI00062805A0|nr:flagellin [Janthinobacterium sp. KBS0711]TSD71818.1 Lateral flagellin [Janthinobacterium sp. KBS0711]